MNEVQIERLFDVLKFTAGAHALAVGLAGIIYSFTAGVACRDFSTCIQHHTPAACNAALKDD